MFFFILFSLLFPHYKLIQMVTVKGYLDISSLLTKNNRLVINKWMFENICLGWRQILLLHVENWSHSKHDRDYQENCAVYARHYQQELHITRWKIQSFMRHQVPVLLMDDDKTCSKIGSSFGEILFLTSTEEEFWNPKICIEPFHA